MSDRTSDDNVPRFCLSRLICKSVSKEDENSLHYSSLTESSSGSMDGVEPTIRTKATSNRTNARMKSRNFTPNLKKRPNETNAKGKCNFKLEVRRNTPCTPEDFICEQILNRHHGVTFLPLLATIVARHVTIELTPEESNKDSRILSDDEAYRFIRDSLARLHNNNRLNELKKHGANYLESDPILSPNHVSKDSSSKMRSNGQRGPEKTSLRDSHIYTVSYRLLSTTMRLNNIDIEYAIGPRCIGLSHEVGTRCTASTVTCTLDSTTDQTNSNCEKSFGSSNKYNNTSGSENSVSLSSE